MKHWKYVFFKKEICIKNVILFNCYKKGNIENTLFLRRKYALKKHHFI